jgi:hypothetical protein
MKGYLMLTRLLCFALLFHIFTLADQPIAGEIHEAAKNGDVKKLKGIIYADKTRLYAQDRLGYTPLNWAAMRNQWAAVRYLIDAGADVNIPGLDGCTPLHCACHNERTDMVFLLLNRGAEIDRRNYWGNAPLHVAAQHGCTGTARILISNGADIDLTSNEGWTPLHYARKAGHHETAAMLIKAGASTTIKDHYNMTPMDYYFQRPPRISIDESKLQEYVGSYATGGGFHFKVWVDGDELWFQDYAHELIYPVGPDSFYCRKNPWTVYFSRDEDGHVDSLFAAFQRQTVGAAKTFADIEIAAQKPKIGILCKSVSPKELQTPLHGAGSDSLFVYTILVLEQSPADRAGMRYGDIILAFANKSVSSFDEIREIVATMESGTQVPLKIWRNGEIMTVTVRLN